jgi:hypothetical protein
LDRKSGSSPEISCLIFSGLPELKSVSLTAQLNFTPKEKRCRKAVFNDKTVETIDDMSCRNYIAAGYITPLEGNFIAKLLALTIFLEVVMEEATNFTVVRKAFASRSRQYVDSWGSIGFRRYNLEGLEISLKFRHRHSVLSLFD